MEVGEAARRASTAGRRSSVTPNLAAILGKVEPPPEALSLQDAPPAVPGPAAGSKTAEQAFFPDLPLLARVQ